MAQRRFHYEQAFEHFLRSNRIPYVAVDEAKRSLLPGADALPALKSFDFVVYLDRGNLLVDVKGRMFGAAVSASSLSKRRFESWVTEDDVESLERWQRLFGDGFRAIFVFAYCLRQQPPDALFESLFEFRERWYALREVGLGDYRREMTPRSSKWRTVHIPAEAFGRISRPFRVAENAARCPETG